MQKIHVRKWMVSSAALWLVYVAVAQPPAHDCLIQPVAFAQVHAADHFWRLRLATRAEVSLPCIRQKCRAESSIGNFLMAAGKKKTGKLSDFPF